MMLNQEHYNKNILPTFRMANGMFISQPSNKDVVQHIKEYVVSSGENHSIRDFVQTAFDYAGVIGEWRGTGADEVFVYLRGNFNIPASTILVRINKSNYRPAEVEHLLGTPKIIQTELGWSPQTSFKQLVQKMVSTDLAK